MIIRVVGIGMGLQHVTPEAAAALRASAYVVAAAKRDDDPLLAVRREVCAAHDLELAATVDYLFGLSATAGVVQRWMYESLAKEYVLDETNQAFMRRSNPWALRGIVERLHEAADRGLWAEPDPEVVAAMQQVYLELEGDLEDR